MIIVAQDFAQKMVAPQKKSMSFDDVHFAAGFAPDPDAFLVESATKILDGDGMEVPDTRERIREAYGDAPVSPSTHVKEL